MALSEQIVLTFGLAGISKEAIPLSIHRAFRLSPSKLLGKIRGLINEDNRTDTAIQKARKLNLRISRIIPTPGVSKVSVNEKHRLESLIRLFILHVREISRRRSGRPVEFLYQLLAKCCERFISEYNTCIAELDSKWLCQYGIINFRDLVVHDCNHLAGIVREALDFKLIPKEDREMANGLLSLNSVNEAFKTWKSTLKRPQ